MWTVVGFVARTTGLGNVVSLLIVLASSAAVLTGTYVYWKHTVIAKRDLYWEAKMLAEKNRVEAIISAEGRKSAERVAVLESNTKKLQKEIDDAEAIIDASPNSGSTGLDADGVSRIDSIH